MKIPGRFKLLGQTISVVFVPGEFTERDGAHGFASYRLNQIQLRPPTETHPLSAEQIGQTFCHELTHFILFHAGAAYTCKDDDMHRDEGFVDLFGSLLHQALTTMEYDHGGAEK